MIRLCTLVAISFVVSTVGVYAQTVDSYELRAYLTGATVPVQTFVFPLVNVTCNVAPTASTSTVNPTTAEWTDVAVIGRVCRFVQTSGPLFSVPVGSYEGTLVAINAAGSSQESARAPFARLDLPGVVSGLRFLR